MQDDIIINESNFDQYFFDIRTNKPKEGQCLARFRGRAEFIDGQLKRDIVEILLHSDRGGNSAQKLMRKLAGANERDSIKVPIQIIEDLKSGLSPEEVCQKSYEYDCEVFYYTYPENVPIDKHWSVIKLMSIPEKRWEITTKIDDSLLNIPEDFNGNDDGSTLTI